MVNRSSRQARGKRTAGRRTRSNAKRARVRSGTSAAVADVVMVTADQRRHLIEDVAFFHADRYRKVEPGRYRKQDRREAEADIARILEERRGR